MTTTPKPEASSAAEPDAAVKTDTVSQRPSDATAIGQPGETETRTLSPAAKRALAEAEARRQARDVEETAAKREIGGRGGADPARYGDWEINGRAIDF